MAETIDELTVTYEDERGVRTKELDKVVLSKGAWTTILFKYQDWNSRLDDFGPPKATIRRYRKVSGSYRLQSRFNISSAKQALLIARTLQEWFGDEEG